MTKIFFLCHGNICRSPMAEFVMKDLVEKAGLSGQFEIASAATSTEEIGNPVYPPARRKLAEHGICCAGKTARQMTRRDYETYDYLIAMDRNNLRNMVRFVGSDPEHKVSLLMEHTSRPGDVADPWYTGEVFDSINLLTWCENRFILFQTQGRERRQMKHTADARHRLPGRMRCSQTNSRQTD